MNLVSGILVPAVQIFIRSKLIYNININEAGLWQAATRISDYYINFLYSVLSVYFLPKLSSIHEIKLLRREIILGYARILPMVLIITGIVWILRDLIISVVLTEEFRGMLPILKLYLIGDVIKICSWILAFLLWAKAMMRAYIISELSFTILSVILNVYFINEYGAIGTGWAYIISYSYYFVLIFLLIRGKLKIKNGYS
ncbi:MAG: hypothetical protein H0U27_09995 [Nitrosopumilus sp.]|nr:hypothetical protein [Nitrosopumilus sp.]